VWASPINAAESTRSTISFVEHAARLQRLNDVNEAGRQSELVSAQPAFFFRVER
jgi:hypothetical protein